MQKYLSVLLFFLSVAALRSAPIVKRATVLIKVVDASNGEPLPFAFIQFDGQRQLYRTDQKGEASFRPRKYPAHFSAAVLGFRKQWFTIAHPTDTVTAALHNDAFTLRSAEVVGRQYKDQLTSNVERLSTERLSQSQNLSMAEQLTALPGMRVLSTGALIQKPILEGMTGSRIAIVDNQSKLVGQHWGDDHAPEMSLPDYAKVLVEKGAKSVKYGSNAMGGVILIDTRLTPSDTLSHLWAHTSYSTNGQVYGGNAAWAQTPWKHFRYRLASKYYRGGSYSTADYLLFNTGSKLFDSHLDLAGEYKNWLFNGHVAYYDADMGIFSGSHISTLQDLTRRFEQGRPAPEDVGKFSYHFGAPKQHVRHFTTNINGLWMLSERDKLNFRFTFQHDYRQEFDLRKGDNTHLPSFAFHLTSYHYHADWQHLYSNRDYFEVGAEMLTAQNVSNTNTKAVPIIPNYSATEIGGYGFLVKEISPRLSGEIGLRLDGKYMDSKGYDWVGKYYGGKRHFLALTGSTGLRYTINQQQHLHVNAGLAWRAPEPNELYSKGVHHGEAIFQQGDTDLKTERALKVTGGYDCSTEKLEIKANAFFHFIHNYIYDVPRYTLDEKGARVPDVHVQLSGTFPIYYYTQSNGIFAGGDLSLGWHIRKDLTYKVRGEWMRARNISLHSYFPDIPTDRYTQSLHYAPKIGRQCTLEADMEHQIVTRQKHFNPDVDLLPDSPPGYQLLNASLTVNLKKGKNTWAFYANGTNLLNKLYKDYTNRMRFFAHDRGRNVTFGIRYSF